MPLTDLKCRQVQPGEKLVKLSDGAGLQLWIYPAGGKLWRGAYRFHGKQKTFSIGPYPEIGLQAAREAWRGARALLREGKDPTLAKRVERLESAVKHLQTFEQVAEDWRKNKYPEKSGTGDEALHRVRMNLYSDLGKLPISQVTPPMVLAALRRIEARGALHMSQRVQKVAARIFDYAIALGLRPDNPAAPVKEAMRDAVATHFAAIDVEQLPGFLADLVRAEPGFEIKTRLATRILMHTFVRTDELVAVPWEGELDLDAGEWIVPGGRTKMKRDHVIPLSRQVVGYFREMLPISGGRKYVFGHRSKGDAHMDNNTILQAIKRMGYAGRMTGHGFRSVAMSAITQQLGYEHAIVDLQLAHVKKNKVDAAYDRAKWLDVRRRMMQEWSDYLDQVEATGKL